MPVEVRAQLTDALWLDLVEPGEGLSADGHVLGDASEILPQRPSTWYLTLLRLVCVTCRHPSAPACSCRQMLTN
jgi:hypothetical protein